ncbi:MAG: hypothetical protein HC803_11910 [Saprospiraceae bacterium]|nr:hypothetical protein [Saprospiraceae bacterium]
MSLDDIPVPQGSGYYYLEGTDVGKGSYTGMIMQTPTTINYGLTSDSNSVYINALVKGTSNAIMEVRILETDNDEYRLKVPVTWTGWKAVNVLYADLIPEIIVGGKREPSKVKQVRIALRSDAIASGVVLNVDYLIFTEGKPFQP